jgi:release factor glutamine methyltransferase
MQLRHALNAAIARLTEAHVGSPRMNAEVLLMYALGCERAYLYSHPERELTSDEEARFDEAVAERARGTPSQYITGHQEFWGLDFIVAPAVLIPRPETEHVVETVLELARGIQRPRIVDVGTGSGCIALALANELPRAEIHAVDLSTAALEIACANAARLQLEGRVHFSQGDLLSGFSEASFDVVVSNPPYVGENEVDVQPQVRDFEPHLALFAGPRGLNVMARLAPQARQALKPGGWLVLEIGAAQENAVRELLRDWAEVEVRPDLRGIPRVVLARNLTAGFADGRGSGN